MALMRSSRASDRSMSEPSDSARLWAMMAAISRCAADRRLACRFSVSDRGERSKAGVEAGWASAERQRRERIDCDQASETVVGVRRIVLASFCGIGLAGREAIGVRWLDSPRRVAGACEVSLDEAGMRMPRAASERSSSPILSVTRLDAEEAGEEAEGEATGEVSAVDEGVARASKSRIRSWAERRADVGLEVGLLRVPKVRLRRCTGESGTWRRVGRAMAIGEDGREETGEEGGERRTGRTKVPAGVAGVAGEVETWGREIEAGCGDVDVSTEPETWRADLLSRA